MDKSSGCESEDDDSKDDDFRILTSGDSLENTAADSVYFGTNECGLFKGDASTGMSVELPTSDLLVGDGEAMTEEMFAFTFALVDGDDAVIVEEVAETNTGAGLGGVSGMLGIEGVE